jgi:hypothetical protein
MLRPDSGAAGDAGAGRPRAIHARHLCPLSSLSTATKPLVRLGFHDSFRPVAETIDRQRSKAFPATAGAKRSLAPPGDEAAERRPGRLTKPPPGGSCGLVLERMRKWQASLSAQRFSNLRVRNRQAGTGFGPAPARQKAGRKSARCHRRGKGFGPLCVGQDRASARELRTGRPRAQVHGLPGRPRGFGRGISCRRRFRASAPGLSAAGAGTPVPDLPSGEPPGLRP